jgi:hypothetical protein
MNPLSALTGKYQTPGGAQWQENCVCTTMDMDHYDRVTGDSTVVYSCRDKTPEGDLISFPGRVKVKVKAKAKVKVKGKAKSKAFSPLSRCCLSGALYRKLRSTTRF